MARVRVLGMCRGERPVTAMYRRVIRAMINTEKYAAVTA